MEKQVEENPIVFCSGKLSKLLGLEKTDLGAPDEMSSWNAHLINISARKNLIFAHKPTLYCFVLPDVLKKDLKDFNKIFFEGLMQQLRYDRLSNPLIEAKLWLKFQHLNLSTSDNDRKTIGVLNHFVSIINDYLAQEGKLRSLQAGYKGMNINNRLAGNYKHYFYPREKMEKWLENNL